MNRTTIRKSLQEGYTLTVLRTDGARLAPLVNRRFTRVVALEAEIERLGRVGRGRPTNVVHWRLQTRNGCVEFDARFVLDGAVDLCEGVRIYSRIILAQQRLFSVATVARAKVMDFAAEVLAEERRNHLSRATRTDAVFSLSMTLLQTSLDRNPRLGALRTQTGNG